MTWTTQQRSDAAGLSAVCQGAGPLVVLLHGVGLRAEAWNRQVTDLAGSGFRVCAPDLPGHGQSPGDAKATRVADYADRVAPLLDRPAIIVGHSMGAMIALELACRDTIPVTGVVALNAIYRRSDAARAAVEDRAAALDGQTVPDPEPTLNRWFGETASAERDACESWLRNTDPAGYKSAYTAFAKGDGPDEEHLLSLRCPALFVTGTREPNSTPAMSRAMSEVTPSGRAEIISGAAHMLPMTHADQLSPLLLAFFRQCSA